MASLERPTSPSKTIIFLRQFSEVADDRENFWETHRLSTSIPPIKGQNFLLKEQKYRSPVEEKSSNCDGFKKMERNGDGMPSIF
ncbi:MAG: hypothetical protein LBP65_01785 [Puniceicoccales bacterium]|nr:hypothetical protein [Puniceicoccales bacterium]